MILETAGITWIMWFQVNALLGFLWKLSVYFSDSFLVSCANHFEFRWPIPASNLYVNAYNKWVWMALTYFEKRHQTLWRASITACLSSFPYSLLIRCVVLSRTSYKFLDIKELNAFYKARGLCCQQKKLLSTQKEVLRGGEGAVNWSTSPLLSSAAFIWSGVWRGRITKSGSTLETEIWM